MMRALWTSASGMFAQQKNIDVISNNIANVNTVGFKGSRADFQDLIYQVIRPSGAINLTGAQIPTGIEIGHGTQLIATPTRFTQGDLKETEDSLDLAVQGEGFFRIRLPDNRHAFTRAGAFSRDTDGNLVTADGLPMDPEIQIPLDASELLITPDGVVQSKLPGENEFTVQGRVQLFVFPNPRGLQHASRGLYTPSEAAGEPRGGSPSQNGLGFIQSGWLEVSNVKVVDEMVGLIIAQRAYEANAKAIQTADDMLSIANTLRR